MNTVVIDLLFGLAATLLGALGASWCARSYFRRKAHTLSQVDAHHAARVLAHLQELATRVAFDVDEHNDRVEEINATLTSAKDHDPKMIVDVVAKLIEANQKMHEKLASTEDKLREQAVEMQVFAAEARTDSLTLLVNRRAFNDELARRFAEYIRQGHTFSLIMSDLDDFKDFNDTHGHLTGDEVLRRVAKVLRLKMRDMDLVARYGGEEFALILPGTNLGDAETAALRACEGIEKTQFHQDGKELHVTMSFGVAEVLDSDDEVTLIARADKALYAAKGNGRNRVYGHDGKTFHRSIPQKQPVPLKDDKQRPRVPKPEAEVRGEKTPPTPNAATAETQPNPVASQVLYIQSELTSRSNFCEHVRYRTAEWKRGGSVFSVVLLELNQPGLSGALHKQQMRLAAMQAAIKFLTTTAREMGVIANYASGSFAMLLPKADLVNAIKIAERLREGISHSNPLAEDKQSGLTLSAGVVQIMGKDNSMSVLKRAEAALDAAKRRGGDGTYYHDGERCAPITALLETVDCSS